MIKRTILIALALVLIPCAVGAEWKQVTHGDTTLCVSDKGDVARCSMDEKGKLTIGQALATKDQRCPT